MAPGHDARGPGGGGENPPSDQQHRVPASIEEIEEYRDPLLQPGSFVGEYQIEQMIGEGGMGSVYRAIQPVIGKKVAIKVLAGVLARDANAVKRFALEARAVNEIGHRNLVDIFSFGRLSDGRHYYVMEFLEGKSLGQELRDRGRMPAEEAFPLFRDIGRALAAAHGKGIIHRDLKPDNVILIPEHESPHPRAKLLDFGVAKLLEQESVPGAPKTQAGATLGTPQYMAPEQCVGGKIDGRTDVYALGIMFFQTLTGTVPFDGATVIEIWQGHVGKPVPKLRDVAKTVDFSPELEALVLQMLAKDPQKRLQSAAQFCEALDAVAPTLGMTPARRGREPRLEAPLVKPSTEVMMESPGGVPRPDTGALRAMAESFSVQRLTDLVPLDIAMTGGEMPGLDAARLAPPVLEAAKPVPHTPADRPRLPGPPTSGPVAAAPDPFRSEVEDLPDIDLGISSVSGHGGPGDSPSQVTRVPRPTSMPPVNTTARMRQVPGASAQRPSEGGGTWLFVGVGILFVLIAAAAAFFLLKRRGGPVDEPPGVEEPQ